MYFVEADCSHTWSCLSLPHADLSNKRTWSTKQRFPVTQWDLHPYSKTKRRAKRSMMRLVPIKCIKKSTFLFHSPSRSGLPNHHTRNNYSTSRSVGGLPRMDSESSISSMAPSRILTRFAVPGRDRSSSSRKYTTGCAESICCGRKYPTRGYRGSCAPFPAMNGHSLHIKTDSETGSPR